MIRPFEYQLIVEPELSHTYLEQVRFACEHGVSCVLLRVKNQPYTRCLKYAKELLAICRETGAVLLINDNVRVAKDIEADGVHLGRSDMSPHQARSILGSQAVIGLSVQSKVELAEAINEGIDYVRFSAAGAKRKDTLIELVREMSKLESQLSVLLRIDRQEIVQELIDLSFHGVAIAGILEDSEYSEEKFLGLLEQYQKILDL